jgi:hypothetical protein
MGKQECLICIFRTVEQEISHRTDLLQQQGDRPGRLRTRNNGNDNSNNDDKEQAA